MVFIGMSLIICKMKPLTLSPFWIKLSGYCFGIYLFQQFILQWLYYHTALQEYIGIIVLPWLAFAVTLILSWLLTHIMMQTRAGRYLIG